MSRPVSVMTILSSLALIATVDVRVKAEDRDARRPNVLLVITDDQGYGDLGVHGNPVIKTPHLDKLAAGSSRLTRFHVSPVCSPTRSSLLTGRYNYRTGVVDTFIGRSMMDPAEVTLAELLSAAGYRTGIFGKWHLGDCYPMRPIDQGFQEALVLRGGGIGQPSDPPGGTSYFDPVLQHNGQPERRKGYCSDVFTDATLDFIQTSNAQKTPFFAYLAFNCPHDPLEVPEEYEKRYSGADLSADRFPRGGYPFHGPPPKAVTAKVYGMVTNIDDNVGRLVARLDQLGITDNTLVVFLTDNGPAQVRYVAGLRGRKGTVYDGGIRAPCFLRWSGVLPEGREFDRTTAHIDLTPTLLDACGVPRPQGVTFDGVSLWPFLTGRSPAADWPSRTLFFQWHRGDKPERFRAFAARGDRYKLVRAEVAGAAKTSAYELFDMAADSYELKDVSAGHPDEVERLKAAYSAWFDDVSRTRGFDPPRIHLGSPREKTTSLTRQDWRGPRAGWGPDALGHWEVFVERPHRARVSLRLKPAALESTATLKLGRLEVRQKVSAAVKLCVFEDVQVPAGPLQFQAWLENDGTRSGVWSAEVEQID